MSFQSLHELPWTVSYLHCVKTNKLLLLTIPLFSIVLFLHSLLDCNINTQFATNRNPQPRTCTEPDITSSYPYWNQQWPFHFIHVMKTMGTTIYSQLPPDYVRKFYGRVSIEDYEFDHKVTLRPLKPLWHRIFHPFSERAILSLDHLNMDQLLDLGLLRCADIETVEVIGIIREPLDWLISHCNHHQRTLQQEMNWLQSSNPQGTGYQTSEWLYFEYDWNLTVFTMENTDGIRHWFRRFGIDIDLNTIHRNVGSGSSGHRQMCRIQDISDEQRKFIRDRLVEDYRIYEAAVRNNGSIQLRHHLRVLND